MSDSRPRLSLHVGCAEMKFPWRKAEWAPVCEAPAEAAAGREVADVRGFRPTVLDNPNDATKNAVVKILTDWTQVGKPIDGFLTFIGHGERNDTGRLETASPCGEESGLDEFIILNGGALCDNFF